MASTSYPAGPGSRGARSCRWRSAPRGGNSSRRPPELALGEHASHAIAQVGAGRAGRALRDRALI
eukprot:9688728-Lingulodinium_polyedra.AAC.1